MPQGHFDCRLATWIRISDSFIHLTVKLPATYFESIRPPHPQSQLKTNREKSFKWSSPCWETSRRHSVHLSKSKTVQSIIRVFAGSRSPRSPSFHSDSTTQKQERCLHWHRVHELNHFLPRFCARIRLILCLPTHARPINPDVMLTWLKPCEDCPAQEAHGRTSPPVLLEPPKSYIFNSPLAKCSFHVGQLV